MTRSINVLGLLLLLLPTACNNTSTTPKENSNDQEKNQAETSSEETSSYQANESLIAWVDLLNVRAKPATNAKVIATLRENAKVIFTGERTDELLKLDLRGQTFEEPWLKVKTSNGEEGWIFGGAVKRQGENKGVKRSSMSIGELTQLQLQQWTKGTEWKSGGGDAENVTTLYTKGALTLAIHKTEVGEYGYSRTYELFNKAYQLIKKRTVNWESDPSFALKETIVDLETAPATTYTRSQAFQQHFYQLKPRPETVKGDFVEGTLGTEETADLRRTILLAAFSYEEWPSNLDKESGCSCIFELEESGGELMVFASDYGDHATIKVNGKMIPLRDGLQAQLARLKKRSEQSSWITLREKGDTELFGEKVDFSGEWRAYLKSELKQTMLVMDRIPTEARIEFVGTVGMGTRGDFNDLWSEAVEEAKGIKQQDNRYELFYQGSQYDCKIEATKVGQNDGGGGKYEGLMQVWSKEGKLLNGSYVYGECGC